MCLDLQRRVIFIQFCNYLFIPCLSFLPGEQITPHSETSSLSKGSIPKWKWSATSELTEDAWHHPQALRYGNNPFVLNASAFCSSLLPVLMLPHHESWQHHVHIGAYAFTSLRTYIYRTTHNKLTPAMKTNQSWLLPWKLTNSHLILLSETPDYCNHSKYPFTSKAPWKECMLA